MRPPSTTVAALTLPRLLGTGSATALVISNMIGATIFGTTGLMLGALGSARLIIAAWNFGAVFALGGALSYAELGINFPSSGGEYVYLSRAYGNAWGFCDGLGFVLCRILCAYRNIRSYFCALYQICVSALRRLLCGTRASCLPTSNRF